MYVDTPNVLLSSLNLLLIEMFSLSLKIFVYQHPESQEIKFKKRFQSWQITHKFFLELLS